MCGTKHDPPACVHEKQHEAPLDEEWTERRLGDAPWAETWVCVVCYASFRTDERRAHVEASGGHTLFLNMGEGKVHCVTCETDIPDSELFWLCKSIWRMRSSDATDRPGPLPTVNPALLAPAPGSADLSAAELAGAGAPAPVNAVPGSGANDAAPLILGWTPMHDAAKEGARDVLKGLIKEHPEMINAIHEEGGWPPLFFACFQGNTHAAEALIKAGASLTFRCDKFGYTALHAAAVGDAGDICDILLQAGANIHALTKEAQTAAAIAASDELKFVLGAYADTKA